MSLNPITSPPLLTTPHGFFTRHGGVSTGVFKALNCGYGSPEARSIIQQNRALIAAEIGVPEAHLFSVTQTHSARVVTLNNPSDFKTGVEADAMVSNQKAMALGVLTADCAPVLFHDPSANVVGAAHAGWRGAFGGVLEATIEAMCALGAKPAGINAVIGPCISQKNYEVGQEFLEAFIDENTSYTRFFVQAQNDKYLFDLPGFALHRLRSANIAEAEWTGQCTYARPDDFFSYRYAQHNNLPSYGRMLSVITN